MKLRVERYAGVKADERPVRFQLDDRGYLVEERLRSTPASSVAADLESSQSARSSEVGSADAHLSPPDSPHPAFFILILIERWFVATHPRWEPSA
jgi:hypothetical protein